MSLLKESEALHGRARAFISAYERSDTLRQQDLPESFDALACDIARFQAKTIPGFARLLRARSVDVDALTRASEIPGVPTDAFKLARISAFPEEDTPFIFRTSGTTVGTRGAHSLRTTETYDRGALALGRRALEVKANGDAAIFALTPPPEEARDSSLIHMFSKFIATFGASVPRSYFISHGKLEVNAFVDALRQRGEFGPSIVLGTSFAFVHLLDALGPNTLADCKVSLALHTGGTKGKTRDIALDEIEQGICLCFGLRRDRCIAEYGMTELSSEFYRAATLGCETSYIEPPWACVYPVDPVSLEMKRDGEIGIAKIVDLLNIDSAISVLTQDRVKRNAHGFELLGRAKGASPRGCSLAVEEMLG